ncbi:glycerol dehydrogenase [Saccharopolyspora sp. HNM0983]|uniref:Glycerol dehydrogenase n=1 Tax=Saccharopolyspora montiporae TaxID=2781240 RepID=A0A929B8R3_9PSEU|nr:glycerol dehydrogenase [Saccharopolyspora sp. HNM0983]MBE9373633.1 glycerol dehydrogenase [Saccharopolyspora sp. HNM0983]
MAAESSALRALISPGRYVQGNGVLTRLGERIEKLGANPLLLADDVVREIVEPTVRSSFDAAGVPVVFERFGGTPTAAESSRVASVLREKGLDVVVGVGGGAPIDTAKAAGDDLGLPVVAVPTVASTDAPTSALSVVYTAEGSFEAYRFYERNPDLVVVDTGLVAGAPVGFLVSGVGDALATWIEARSVVGGNGTTMAGGSPTKAGTALAKLSWDILWESAPAAVRAVAHDLVTPDVEAVVEANTLLSGLGFESGGLAAAHAIHDGLTAVPQTHGLSHGQKVNIGSIAQLVLEGTPDAEVAEFARFTAQLGLPTTLTEAGLAGQDQALRSVAEAATDPAETIHNMRFRVGADDVVRALRAVELVGRHVRAQAGLPDPRPPAGH